MAEVLQTKDISATKKRRTKSKRIIPAIIGGAVLAAGLGGLGRTVFGGSSGGSNGNLIDGLTRWLKGTSDISKTALSASEIATAGTAGSLSRTGGNLLAQGGNVLGTIFDKISGMSSTSWLGISTVADIFSGLFDDSDEILAEQFQDKLKFGYDELKSLEERTAMEVAAADRRNAASSTFMGHTAAPAIAEGVNVEQGYQPRPAASYGEFHPKGLLS